MSRERRLKRTDARISFESPAPWKFTLMLFTFLCECFWTSLRSPRDLEHGAQSSPSPSGSPLSPLLARLPCRPQKGLGPGWSPSTCSQLPTSQEEDPGPHLAHQEQLRCPAPGFPAPAPPCREPPPPVPQGPTCLNIQRLENSASL